MYRKEAGCESTVTRIASNAEFAVCGGGNAQSLFAKSGTPDTEWLGCNNGEPLNISPS